MGWGNLIVMVFLAYFSIYFIKILDSKERKGIQSVNKKLDDLRKIPIKSLDKQKEFLNLKYPKSGKFVWRWRIIPEIFIQFLTYFLMFLLWQFIFSVLKINLQLWHGMIIIIVAPLIFNLILERFYLQKGDIRVFLK